MHTPPCLLYTSTKDDRLVFGEQNLGEQIKKLGLVQARRYQVPELKLVQFQTPAKGRPKMTEKSTNVDTKIKSKKERPRRTWITSIQQTMTNSRKRLVCAAKHNVFMYYLEKEAR